MGQTPSVDDLIAELAAMTKRMDELERKTLSSLAVTDPGTQAKTLQIDQDSAHSNRARFQVRDSAGGRVIANDTGGAGWGLAAPTVTYPSTWGAATASTQFTGGTLVEGWTTLVPVTSQRLRIIANAEINTVSSKVGTYQLSWYPFGDSFGGASTVVIDSFTVPCNNNYIFQSRDATYPWPSNMLGQLVVISYGSKISATGAGEWTAYTPATVTSVAAA